MAYIATRKVNTSFGSYEAGTIVPDSLGEQYSAFEKVEEKKTEKKTRMKTKKKPKKEILTEVSEPVQVEVAEE